MHQVNEIKTVSTTTVYYMLRHCCGTSCLLLWKRLLLSLRQPASTLLSFGGRHEGGIMLLLTGGEAAVATFPAPDTQLRVVLLQATLHQPLPPQGTKDQTDRLRVKDFLPSHHKGKQVLH